MVVINRVSNRRFLRVNIAKESSAIIGAKWSWCVNARASNIRMHRIAKSGFRVDEAIRGRIVMIVAVDPGEGTTEVEVELGRAEGSFHEDGDGVEKGVVVFVNGSNKGCLERKKRKRKKEQEQEKRGIFEE